MRMPGNSEELFHVNMSHAIFSFATSLWQCPHFPLIIFLAVSSHPLACRTMGSTRARAPLSEAPLYAQGLTSTGQEAYKQVNKWDCSRG